MTIRRALLLIDFFNPLDFPGDDASARNAVAMWQRDRICLSSWTGPAIGILVASTK